MFACPLGGCVHAARGCDACVHCACGKDRLALGGHYATGRKEAPALQPAVFMLVWMRAATGCVSLERGCWADAHSVGGISSRQWGQGAGGSRQQEELWGWLSWRRLIGMPDWGRAVQAVLQAVEQSADSVLTTHVCQHLHMYYVTHTLESLVQHVSRLLWLRVAGHWGRLAAAAVLLLQLLQNSSREDLAVKQGYCGQLAKQPAGLAGVWPCCASFTAGI